MLRDGFDAPLTVTRRLVQMPMENGREVVIVEAVRTPIGRGHPEKGYYKDTHPNELLGKCYTEVIERAGIPAEEVEDMGHNPMGVGFKWVDDVGSPWPEELMAKYDLVPQGISAEMIADQWEIPRSELDEIGLRSHQLAHQATEEGRFERETIPFSVNGDTYVADQGIRPDTSLEKLAQLKPAFKEDGKVTAGNSSQISDGAAAVLVMTREKADEYGLKPRARIMDQTTVGVDPVIMLTGPIPATNRLLERNSMTMK